MLNEKQVNEIREHLEAAQNPLFFFDNDQDGLCSFSLLQRYIERGKGISIKSFPELTKEYFRKVNELNADYIFILDKAVVSDEFFEEAHKMNIPVVYIDHHDAGMKVPDYVNYYNPALDKIKKYEPVSAFCYQVTGKKEDFWIAVIGCICDAYTPPFYEQFKKDYPDLVIDSDDPLDIFYTSSLGKIGQILGAGLKDKTTNVISMLKFLMKVKTPYEILEENSKNYTMHKRFNEIDRKFRNLLEKAESVYNNSEKVIFFQYSGDLSISSEVANALKQKFPEKTIVVGYVTGAKVNISARGKEVKRKVLEVIKDLEGATGGGHDEAVGAKINADDWETFKKKFSRFFK